MSETIFDKIIAKEIPAEIVYEDDHVLAFKDIAPQAPIHVLVIPKQKFKSFVELEDGDDDVIATYMKRVSKVASELGLDRDGYRVVFNSGKEGGQSVDYIHAHILGGRQLIWPPG